VAAHLEASFAPGLSLEAALRLAVSALGHSESGDRTIEADYLEVALLDRTRSQPRKFSRLRETRLAALLETAEK
jgi:proteasome alpha subunit